MTGSENLFDLSGRVVLLTGGSRGLGLAMANALGEAGASLAITARKQAELNIARAELARSGYPVLAIASDLAEEGAAAHVTQSVLQQYGHIDVLLNNASATWGEPASRHALSSWRRVIDVNVNGTFALSQAVATAAMIPRRRGVIIIVSSIASRGGNHTGGTPTAAYNASKAAQVNLTQSLAAEWGVHGIRVNALLPGWFPSKMTAATLASQGADLLRRVPLGRFGMASADLAGPIIFLASEASRYVTGASLIVDGGMTCAV